MGEAEAYPRPIAQGKFGTKLLPGDFV